jgi:predicted metal-dependent enzyme (double-stranded beta helix superfamily)
MAVILDNLIKQSYGGMYVTGGGGTQNTDATPGVYVKCTQFTVNGAASDLVVPDHANDRIQVYKSGIWLCSFSFTFDPGTSDTYYAQVWAGAIGGETARTNITSAAKIQNANDWTSFAATGFITLSTYDVVWLGIACSAANKAVAVKQANLILLRVSGS